MPVFSQTDDTFIDLASHQIIHLYRSLNQPHLSPGAGASAEASSAYFILAEQSEERLMLFVGLVFHTTEGLILYKSETFQPEETPERLAQAESFAGEMGFLMDDLRFSRASDVDRKEMLRTTPFFYKDRATFLQALSEEEKEAKAQHTQATSTRESSAHKYSYFLEQYVTILSML